MEHLAIMKKSWGLTEKILSGEKKIESRWYKSRAVPWGNIKPGEVIYFKNSGAPVTIKAEIEKVLQFSDLSPQKVKELLERYGKEDGIDGKSFSQFYEMFKDKNYCILAFLKNPQSIKPFEINKKGFGMMSAWITTGSIKGLKIK